MAEGASAARTSAKFFPQATPGSAHVQMANDSSPRAPEPPQSDLQPPPEEVAARARQIFGVAYLTLTGVTQSVALAVLVARVEETSPHFHFTNWVMAIATFLNITLIWNEYLIVSIAYVWTTTVLDALFPFALLALQAFLAHNVYPNQRVWLTALGALFGAGAAAYVYGFWRVARHPRENRDIVRVIGVHRPLTMVITATACGLCWGAALLYDVAGLGHARLVVAIAAFLLVLITLLRSIPYWRCVTRYARL
jgi:hypothetical protein